MRPVQRRRPLPMRVHGYIAVTVAGALLLLPLTSFARGAVHGFEAALDALVLAALIAGAHRFPMLIGPKRRLNVGTAPEVAAVLLLPGPLATLVLASGALAGAMGGRARPVQHLFNTAVWAVRGVVGTTTYAGVQQLSPDPVAEPIAALTAAALIYLSSTLLVRGIVAVQSREHPFRRTSLPPREIVMAEAALSVTGVIAAVAAVEHAWVLPLLVAPALIVQRAVRNGVALQAQTRRIEEELSERKRLEEMLAHQAFHDALTGLPNRTLFLDRLAHALAGTARRPEAVAVLFCDLDGFKVINDRLGHAAGDAVLVTVGQRVAGCLRPTDTLARFGGDEFLVLLPNILNPHDALSIAQRIIDAVRQPILLEGQQEVFATASIGVALSSLSAVQAGPEGLIRDADSALYEAKAAGKARAAMFRLGMRAEARERLELESDLRRAVQRGELRVHYQPEVDVGSGAIVGVEALVRWQHPHRGLIAPDEFIPLAEEIGLIGAIDAWVLARACEQARQWQSNLPAKHPLLLSVNLSARDLQSRTIVQTVAAALEATRLPAGALRLEITESALMHDVEAAGRTLHALKALGVRLAIDDFGTGYSSLNYLRHLPVDTVKIDRSFIGAIDTDADTREIVRAVVTLAHALGMEVTAEGIETSAELAWVRSLACDRGQGYFFAPPVTADLFGSTLLPRPTLV